MKQYISVPNDLAETSALTAENRSASTVGDGSFDHDESIFRATVKESLGVCD